MMKNRKTNMRVTVELTKQDLAEMGATAELLEGSVRQQLSSLDLEGDTLYITDVNVTVVVTDEN
jgi:hypothetical protein